MVRLPSYRIVKAASESSLLAAGSEGLVEPWRPLDPTPSKPPPPSFTSSGLPLMTGLLVCLKGFTLCCIWSERRASSGQVWPELPVAGWRLSRGLFRGRWQAGRLAGKTAGDAQGYF